VDILDEGLLSPPCSYNGTCVDLLIGSVCSCPPGYFNNGFRDCIDINECASNSHQCHRFRDCINTIGNYTCNDCYEGWKNNGTYDCIDINECETQTHYCTQLCINGTFPAGSFTCSCREGFILADKINCKAVENRVLMISLIAAFTILAVLIIIAVPLLKIYVPRYRLYQDFKLLPYEIVQPWRDYVFSRLGWQSDGELKTRVIIPDSVEWESMLNLFTKYLDGTGFKVTKATLLLNLRLVTNFVSRREVLKRRKMDSENQSFFTENWNKDAELKTWVQSEFKKKNRIVFLE